MRCGAAPTVRFRGKSGSTTRRTKARHDSNERQGVAELENVNLGPVERAVPYVAAPRQRWKSGYEGSRALVYNRSPGALTRRRKCARARFASVSIGGSLANAVMCIIAAAENITKYAFRAKEQRERSRVGCSTRHRLRASACPPTRDANVKTQVVDVKTFSYPSPVLADAPRNFAS